MLALLTAFIAMFLSALQDTWEVSNDQIKANEGMKSAQVRSKSTLHPTLSHSMQEIIHKTFRNAQATMYLDIWVRSRG